MVIYGYQLQTQHYQSKEILSFSSADELKDKMNIVVIVEANVLEQDALLQQLHHQPFSWSWKIYTIESSPLAQHLSDGLVVNNDITADIEKHQAKYKQLGANAKDKLLAWLWMDSKRILLPFKSPLKHKIYSYPLLAPYIANKGGSKNYLKPLLNRDYLYATQFVDRVRSCSHCSGNHLNYIESCPACQSQHIHSKNSLHCFTCGFVEHEEKFNKANKLSCPKCLTQLKHIGVDYDRPLEVYECLDCEHGFIEAKTVVNCFSCQKVAQIDALSIEHINVFSLGENASHYLLNNIVTQASSLHFNESIEANNFVSLLAWINRLTANSDQGALLLNLSLLGRDEYIELHGQNSLRVLIDELRGRTSDIFNQTEMSCLYRENRLLILLPMTAETSLPLYQEKLNQVMALADVSLRLKLDAWSLPVAEIGDDAEAWLAKELDNV